jgi:hypothetical protein
MIGRDEADMVWEDHIEYVSAARCARSPFGCGKMIRNNQAKNWSCASIQNVTSTSPSATEIRPEEEPIIEACKVGRQAIDDLLECDPGDSEKFRALGIQALRDRQWLLGKAQKVRAMRPTPRLIGSRTA